MRLERTVSWSQTRRDTNFAIPGYSISAIIPRRRGKSKIFLSVVIYVVKAAFVPFSATGENPANAGVTRLSGVSPGPVPDTATALPNFGTKFGWRWLRHRCVGPLGLLAMTTAFCHSEASAHTGRGNPSFLRWTGVRAAEVVGPCGKPN